MEFLIIISALNYPFPQTQFIQGKELLTVCNAVIPSVWGLNSCYPDSESASVTVTVNTLFIYLCLNVAKRNETKDKWFLEFPSTSAFVGSVF